MKHWKDFNYRNIWQSDLWKKVYDELHRETWLLEVDGAAALVIEHQLPFTLSWLEIPRGPLFKDEKSFKAILKEIEELAHSQSAVFVRMSSYKTLPKIESNHPFKVSKYDHHPEASLVVDLTQTEDEILEQMKPKGRYNIKVALKHDVSVEVSEDIDTFYGILKTTANRDGFGLHEKKYYERMLKGLGDNGQLLMAKYQDRPVAGGIFVYLDEWGVYYYGASENQYRKTMATYLVQWEAMKEAKKRGCKHYDFLGVAPEDSKNHPWAGVTKFKSKFGGRVVEYPNAQDWVLRPYWYLAYKLSKIFR